MFAFIPQNRFILEGALEIHNGGQNARFGSALAPVPDLNGDGFNDLVVGAPLEDDHKGAIYVFFSQHNRILRKYKQVGSVLQVHLKENISVFTCLGIKTLRTGWNIQYIDWLMREWGAGGCGYQVTGEVLSAANGQVDNNSTG